MDVPAHPDSRRDLDAEDKLGEAENSRRVYGRVRSVLDVPFAFGTLAVNSLEPPVRM